MRWKLTCVANNPFRISVAYRSIFAAIPPAIPPQNKSFVQPARHRTNIETAPIQRGMYISAQVDVSMSFGVLGGRSHHNTRTP